MNKEIQEIAKILYNHQCGEDECGKCRMPHCLNYKKAKQLYECGYRKVSPEKEKAPGEELEALKKLKRKVFLGVWGYWGRPDGKENFEYAFSIVSYAGLLDECMQFCDLAETRMDQGEFNDEDFEKFLKEYFGV